jgi:hypothetical protein
MFFNRLNPQPDNRAQISRPHGQFSFFGKCTDFLLKGIAVILLFFALSCEFGKGTDDTNTLFSDCEMAVDAYYACDANDLFFTLEFRMSECDASVRSDELNALIDCYRDEESCEDFKDCLELDLPMQDNPS